MRIAFSEGDQFYARLDKAVQDGEAIEITFVRAKLRDDSKLWRRLRKCKNWSKIEAQLKSVAAGKTSPLAALLTDVFLARLTGGEVVLVAWIATLIAGLLFYAVYKNYRARLEVDPKTGKGSIHLDPA